MHFDITEFLRPKYGGTKLIVGFASPTDRPTSLARGRFRVGLVRPTDRRAERGEENFGSERSDRPTAARSAARKIRVGRALHCRAERGEEKIESVWTDRPTAAQSAAKIFWGRKGPTDRPTSGGGRGRKTNNQRRTACRNS